MSAGFGVAKHDLGASDERRPKCSAGGDGRLPFDALAGRWIPPPSRSHRVRTVSAYRVLFLFVALAPFVGCLSPQPPATCTERVPSSTPHEVADGSQAASAAPSVVMALPYDLPRGGAFSPPPADSVTLPNASHAEPMRVVLGVVIAKTGDLIVDARPAPSTQDLIRLARESKERNGGSVRAVIYADRDVPWGRVVQVFDLLKQGGITELAFAVEVSPQARP
jgi:hypothetical protein